MFKTICLFIIVVLSIGTIDAQRRVDRPLKVKSVSVGKTFNLTIKLDSSIAPKRVWYQYYDGRNTILLPDTLTGRREVVIRRKYYSEQASFIISYMDSARVGYRLEFLIGDKPAAFTAKLIPNDEHLLGYTDLKNAIPTEDTVVNKSWAHRVAFMKRYSNPKENAEADLFLKQHPDFYKSDSLKQIFAGFMKHFQQLDMDWIKTYPNDYFSFWYFNNHIAEVSSFNSDKAHLQKQLNFYKTVFPARFTNTIEGRWMIKKFEDRIHAIPFKPADVVPVFAIKTIDGKKINLNQFKGKYVLLDFWATWCAPCMAEMPFVKDLRKKYSPGKLVIIGISDDTNSKAMREVIKKQQMNWLHYQDEDQRMRELYQVTSIPMLFLIDKTGKLLYKSDLEHADTERLSKVLETLN
jgi:peroxiredoxin